jgi:hypothetical protein
MMVAITSVHPGCGLHPVHPGCTSGYGDWWAGMLAGAWSGGLYAYFSAPAGRGKEPAGQPPKPRQPKSGGGRSQAIESSLQGAFALVHRAMTLSYPLSFLLLPQGVGN